MKAVFKRIRASGMIEGIFICMLIMIGCYTIVRVTRYGQRQLMHMNQTAGTNTDLYYIQDQVSTQLDFVDEYPVGMKVDILETCQKYQVTYNGKIYIVNKGSNDTFTATFIGKREN